MAKCRHCGEDAGFLRRAHGHCERAHDEARAALVARVAEAALAPALDADSLRLELNDIAAAGRVDGDDVRESLAEGWNEAAARGLDDASLSRDEEDRLHAFRAAFALTERETGRTLERLADASRERLRRYAMLAADSGDAQTMGALEAELRDSSLPEGERRALLAGALTDAIDRALDDDLLSREEESAIDRYLERFGLDGDGDPVLREARARATKAMVIRSVCEGTVPEVNFRAAPGSMPIPFNFQKSEQLVWLFDGVDYYQMRTRREFRGGSTGASVRVARGVYLRQSAFRGHPVSVTETVKADAGLLGVTTRHIYFHGARERFRVRLDRIVSFEPHSDGIGIMRDLARAKPEAFRTDGEDGWFLYNLVTNVARL